ncbi:MAG: ECF transporter S component [Mitsuokella sp.]
MSKNKTYSLCMTAVLMALTCIATMVIQIPIPLGYAHLGDCVILLAVLFLNRRNAVLAASIGSMLADFFTGFAIWCVPTLLIKSAIVLTAHPFCAGRSFPRLLLGGALSMLVMAAGYTLAGALLYGSLAVGLASTPGLLAEGALNLALFLILAKTIVPALSRYLDRKS